MPEIFFGKAVSTLSKNPDAADIRAIRIKDMNDEIKYLPKKQIQV
jgi:hypothetical protein